MNWRLWIYSLAHSVIGGCASAGTAMFVAPETFNMQQWHKLAALVVASGMVSLFNFLSKSPLPEWNGCNRRNAPSEGASK